MYETPLSRGLNTGGSNYNYLNFQNYNTSQTNTCSQTISNMSAGTYTLSIWITPRKTNYFSTQTGNVTIGGTTVITCPAFTNNGTTTPWSHLTGTYTLTAGTAGSKVLAINIMNSSAANVTTVYISTVSLKRTA